MKRLIALAMSLGLVAAIAAPVAAEVNSVTPSTNEQNAQLGWAHFAVGSVGPGEATVDFISSRGFYSCFEYRSDGDTSQRDSDTNYNPDVTDGLYPFTCVNDSTETEVLHANDYVEIRMVFGAERDERFDWTRVDVVSKANCKDGGWMDFGYKNQGACISAVVSED